MSGNVGGEDVSGEGRRKVEKLHRKLIGFPLRDFTLQNPGRIKNYLVLYLVHFGTVMARWFLDRSGGIHLTDTDYRIELQIFWHANTSKLQITIILKPYELMMEKKKFLNFLQLSNLIHNLFKWAEITLHCSLTLRGKIVKEMYFLNLLNWISTSLFFLIFTYF